MEKIVTEYKKSKEEIEKEIAEVKKAFDVVFSRARELGVSIDIPRSGHVVLNPENFAYYHKDEVWHLNYKV